jgi:transposase
MANASENSRSKTELLREEGALNPAAEKVLDAKFRDSEFFDPRDLVQVKYEMLRRVSIENAAVVEVVQAFGVSRPTYYQARASLERAGIAGLVPKKRGPRGPHKMHGEALAFVKQQLVSGQPLRARQLARLLQQELHLKVHPRTIERALRGKKTAR